MKFENSFDVDAPIDEVWKTLLDLERVAPAMPGAQVLERTGENTYKVGIKVKVGPVTMQYQGDVEVIEANEATHTATLRVKAKEARGQGTANADVTQHLEPRDGGTRATVIADVQLSGKAAAMSRGIIEDVSARLVRQFADNLQKMLAGGPPAEAPAAEEAAAPAPSAEQPTRVEQPTVVAQQPPPPAEPTAPPAEPMPPPAAPEEKEAVFDAGALAGSMVADRLRDPKVLAAAIGGALLVGYVLGRAAR